MSASWSEQRRRIRPRKSGVPVEISTQPASRSCESADKSDDKTKGTTRLWDSRTPHRIQLIPGSLLISEPWLCPPPPKEHPPVPTEIVQLLVIGDRQSGKTSMITRFLQRHCVNSLPEASKQKKKGPWSVEYHKKDVTFWHQHDSAEDENAIGCARVQLWDVTGAGPWDDTFGDKRQEWIQLVHKMSATLLVVSLEHGSDALWEALPRWKAWLDESSCPQIHLFLHKSDLLPLTGEPQLWIEFGSRLSRICNELGIADWRLTSCTTGNNDDDSPEDAIMNVVRNLVTTTVTRPKEMVAPNASRLRNTGKFRSANATTVEAKAVPIP